MSVTISSAASEVQDFVLRTTSGDLEKPWDTVLGPRQVIAAGLPTDTASHFGAQKAVERCVARIGTVADDLPPEPSADLSKSVRLGVPEHDSVLGV